MVEDEGGRSGNDAQPAACSASKKKNHQHGRVATPIGRFPKPSIGKTKIPYRAPYSDYKLAIVSREIAIGERNSYTSKVATIIISL